MSQSAVNVAIPGLGSVSVETTGGDPTKNKELTVSRNVLLGNGRYYPRGRKIRMQNGAWRIEGSSLKNNDFRSLFGSGRRSDRNGKRMNVRPSQNSDEKAAKSVLVITLPSGSLVTGESVIFANKTIREGANISKNSKGWYITKSNSVDLNAKKRKDKFLKFITQTEYYSDKKKILDAINVLEGVGITIFRDLKELILSNPEEDLNKKFVNPKKAVMGINMKKRGKIRQQLKDITRLVYINRLFRKFKDYLKYLKDYDDTLVEICCYYIDK